MGGKSLLSEQSFPLHAMKFMSNFAGIEGDDFCRDLAVVSSGKPSYGKPRGFAWLHEELEIDKCLAILQEFILQEIGRQA